MVSSKEPRSFVRSRSGRAGRLLGGVLLGGALVLTSIGAPLAARAQEAAEAPDEGITVIGYGEASAPAETVDLQIVVSTVNFSGPVAPSPDAVPGEAERESVGPLVEGLIAAGIPEDDISVVISPVANQYYGPGGPGATRVDVTVDEPTVERIDELISAAVVGAAEENLIVAQIGVGYGVSDCESLYRDARQNAFDDAESRADLQAEVMGVERGDALAASDLPLASSSFDPYFGGVTSSESSCSPPVPTSTVGGGISLPSYDPSGEAEVSVYAQVAVTFALGESSGEDSSDDATPVA